MARKAPVYLYYFRWETPVEGGRLRSRHDVDIPVVFDNVKLGAPLTRGGQEAMALAERISDARIAFARTGDPNTSKLPHWPAFKPTDRPTMIFDAQSVVENDPIRQQRAGHVSCVELELTLERGRPAPLNAQTHKSR
jgi:para-nitrobenzyl esterase